MKEYTIIGYKFCGSIAKVEKEKNLIKAIIKFIQFKIRYDSASIRYVQG